MIERKLIVGIDFGTTFSGVAWAETKRPDHLAIVNVWPSGLGMNEGVTQDKVPTEIRYTPEGMEWGFQIPRDAEKQHWFKLALSGESRASAPYEKLPEELTTDFLTALSRHFRYFLEQKLGATILRTVPLEFCLTVPAIWSEVAKEKTLKACKDAGLSPSQGKISLVSEPEAAAIFALHDLDPHELQIGDSFVLCDAGGGTVDLISYTIAELQPILKIREAAPGTGGYCGSTYLNQRFGEFLVSKLGDLAGWDTELLCEAMDRFEFVIKRSYLPSNHHQDGYTILVPGLENNAIIGIKNGRFKVTSLEMQEIFDPVIQQVIELIQGQIRATEKNIRAVLLVGGFGQSMHLKERLRNALGDTIEVLQPPNAWTSVVRGAVMMGLARANSRLASVSMESRTARKHYGLKLNFEFDLAIHDNNKKYWCDRHRCYRVPAMEWFIEKGDAVEENIPKALTFVSHFLVSNGKPESASIKVWCDHDSTTAPIHKNSNVKQLVTLVSDLRGLSAEDLESSITRCADGQDWYEISGAVEATYSSASTKYVLLYEGVRYDTVTAEYV
ncbi:Heat shock 70 kDa protein 12A [Lachnellula suecica]|uniref:Heat shock 70 kDa protein 12A n=1 Tax=Lachnellula suecica TaxID=602035 RepID=A0A8T9CC41_9HELO|nr:Heat shock 70 kDa protein 12A [Lachnellula suecica]